MNKKDYRLDYYHKNKEKEDKRSNEWKKNNKDKFYKSVKESRRRRVERLRSDGCVNAWNVVTKGAKPKYERSYYD